MKKKNLTFNKIGYLRPARLTGSQAVVCPVDFHAPDRSRAKLRFQRWLLIPEIIRNELALPKPPPFSEPNGRAFSPDFSRRALRNFRQITGMKNPAKVTARFIEMRKMAAVAKSGK